MFSTGAFSAEFNYNTGRSACANGLTDLVQTGDTVTVNGYAFYATVGDLDSNVINGVDNDGTPVADFKLNRCTVDR
jgi:hypothetical protein